MLPDLLFYALFDYALKNINTGINVYVKVELYPKEEKNAKVVFGKFGLITVLHSIDDVRFAWLDQFLDYFEQWNDKGILHRMINPPCLFLGNLMKDSK